MTLLSLQRFMMIYLPYFFWLSFINVTTTTTTMAIAVSAASAAAAATSSSSHENHHHHHRKHHHHHHHEQAQTQTQIEDTNKEFDPNPNPNHYQYPLPFRSSRWMMNNIFHKKINDIDNSDGAKTFEEASTTTKRKLQQENDNNDNDNNTNKNRIRQFELWKPEKFQTTLRELQELYPTLVQLTTAQETFGLPAAGGEHDCPFWEDSNGCPNYILTIQDLVAHPIDSTSSNLLPEVFWSGCLHGNERVGPTAVMEAVLILLKAAHCESLPRHDSNNDDLSIKEAKLCRQQLHDDYNINAAQRKWLARLVSTRRIVVVPTTNALGYFQNKREEGMVDPNRDFPYDLDDARLCMQTIAGRTVNELYRTHMFQLALTFHAGMEVVGYEWGAPTWLNHFSPDDEGQSEIASAYSRFGGGWSTSKPYQYGTMNDLVYYVRGGMEDWAYAGSWDPDRVVQCQPTTFGGYPKEKTVYDNSTLRVFNMLVETSDKKEPRTNDLGSTLDVLNRDTQGNGHVSRNIRLALLAAELVQPYVSIVGVNELALSDDIVPLTERTEPSTSCQKSNSVMVSKTAQSVQFQWTVGGALTIDSTDIWYAKWDDLPKKKTNGDNEEEEETLDCITQPSMEFVQKYFTKGTVLGPTSGTGTFSRAGAHPRPRDESSSSSTTSTNIPIENETNGPIFTGTIPVSNNAATRTMDQFVILVSARVDQNWKDLPNNVSPSDVPPQSHVVNARTNPDWYGTQEGNNKRIQGRLDWFSIPLTVVIGDYTDTVGTTQGGTHVITTIELHPRFVDTAAQGGVQPKSAATAASSSIDQLWFPVGMWEFLAITLLILVICLGCCCMCMTRRKNHPRGNNSNGMKRGRSRKPRNGGGGIDPLQQPTTMNNDDEFVFESKPYSDRSSSLFDNDEDEDDDDDDEYDDEYDDDDDDEFEDEYNKGAGQVELSTMA